MPAQQRTRWSHTEYCSDIEQTKNQLEIYRSKAEHYGFYFTGQLERSNVNFQIQAALQLDQARSKSWLINNWSSVASYKICSDWEDLKKYVHKNERRILGTEFDFGVERKACIKTTEKNQDSSHMPILIEKYKNLDFKIDLLQEWIVSDGNKYFSTWNKFMAWREMFHQCETRQKKRGDAKKFMENLYQWQVLLKSYLNQTVDDRSILVVYDKYGNSGKSSFAKHYHNLHRDTTLMLDSGKSRDMAQMARDKAYNLKVIFMDVMRSAKKKNSSNFVTSSQFNDGTDDIINWEFIERLKNGIFNAHKYYSELIEIPTPHIVVLTKWLPNTTTVLTMDRWQLLDVKENRLLKLDLTQPYKSLRDAFKCVHNENCVWQDITYQFSHKMNSSKRIQEDTENIQQYYKIPKVTL